MKSFLVALATVVLVNCSSSVGSPPNCIHSVTRHDPQGWLIRTAIVRFVFWGSYWSDIPEGDPMRTTLRTWDVLLNSSTPPLFQRLAEYGIQGSIMSPDAVMGNFLVTDNLVDATVPTALNQQIASGDLSPPDDGRNTIYVVFLPPGTLTVNMRANKWIGYHGSASFGATAYAYAVIGDYTDAANISHELYETVTDPDGRTGYRDPFDGEVGDLCEVANELIDNVWVQKVWSQAACQCE